MKGNFLAKDSSCKIQGYKLKLHVLKYFLRAFYSLGKRLDKHQFLVFLNIKIFINVFQKLF